MRLDKYTAKSRILDIKSPTFEGAMDELLKACDLPERGKNSKTEVLKALLEREKSMTTYLGRGVAMPHLRIPMSRPYVIAIGRCPDGLEYEGMEEYRELRLIVVLLASDKEKSYLNVLASLARVFEDRNLVGRLMDALTLASFRDQVKRSFSGFLALPKTKSTRFNKLILTEAAKIAKGAKCSAIMIFADTFEEPVNLGLKLDSFRTVLVTQSSTEMVDDTSDVIMARSYSHNRLSQMRSAVLIGLSRGVLNFNDKLCCVAGIPKSNQFDTVVVVDIQNEFQAVFTQQLEMLPSTVRPEVMERVLAIATELAVEGREGKPVGCLFVIGGVKDLKPFSKPLVLNPFYGYKDEDRNILNPFMDETVKEFSTIDGAFIIRGDGVLESAGTLIYAPDFIHELPGGLGSRHAAAAAVSEAADCIAVTVSASTRQVTIFRRGQMLPLM